MAKGRIVGPGTFLKRSPNRFVGAAIGAVTGVVGGISNLIGGNKALGAAEAQQRRAQQELNKRKEEFEALDTSNIYADVQNPYENISMENVYEDLTVNQQQAQFQAQQGAQQRANIMENLRGAAGGSGVAALAQQMASQGQLATQQASASIGQQEAANQRLMAQGAQDVLAREQMKARGASEAEMQRLRGAEASRGLEYDKTQTMIGMASGELAAANQAEAAAEAQKQQGIQSIAGGVGSGLMAGAAGGVLGTKAFNIMSNIKGAGTKDYTMKKIF